MRAVAFTDLHTHNYTTFSKNGSRLENCLAVIDDVYALCLKAKSEIILFAGDIVDQQQAVPTVTSIELTKRLRARIDEHPEIIWYIITGNHDQGAKSIYGGQGAHSYAEYLSIVFPNNIILVDNSNVQLDLTFIHGIPYYQHPEHFRKALEDRAEMAKGIRHSGGINILMIHQTPSGLPNPNIPIDTDINDPLYDDFDIVLCGHIHQRAELSNKFFLLGSPLHRDLGDEGDEKGIYVLDCAEPAETLTFVTRKGKYPEFKRIKGAISAEDRNNFVIPELDIQIDTNTAHNVENFDSKLSPAELLENYWEEVDGKDNELLKQGLEFIK